jgi:hypothetical protein
MHMDGADDGTTFTDVTGKVSTVSGAVTKTGVKKFGTASGFFDGVDDRITFADSADWDLPGDFVIEGWFRTSAPLSGQAILNINGTNGLVVAITTGGKLQFASQGGGGSVIGTTTVIADTWYNFAIERNSGLISAYLDGVSEGTPLAEAKTYSSDQVVGLAVGVDYSAGSPVLADTFAGYIDDLRITKGVARYTANFTPPTAAFPDQ